MIYFGKPPLGSCNLPSGCFQLGRLQMPTKDIAGQRFGKLVAIRPIGSKSGHTVWLCKCDCGNEHEALSHNLMQGTVKSCGCLVRESNRKKAKHGMHETRLYRVWAAVKIRCYSKNHPTYKNYGARGIGCEPEKALTQPIRGKESA